MEPDIFVPGDEQYQMINEPLQPMGLETLMPKEKTKLPNLVDIAKNVAKNKAINYAAGKLGIEPAVASGLTGLLGVGANVFAPLAAVSALTGRSLGISEYLANKRAQKQLAKSENMLESKVLSNQLAGQVTPQSIIDDRGRGQIPSRTTASAPTPSRQARQTAGIGGLHSGY